MSSDHDQPDESFQWGPDFVEHFPQFAPHLACLMDLLAYMGDVVGQPRDLKGANNEDTCHRVVTMLLATKGTKTAHALALLLSRGFIEDAAVLLRSLLEVVINLKYIAASEGRARLYLQYEAVAIKRMIDVLQRQGYDVSGADPKLQKMYEAVKGDYPDDWKGWSQKSISKRANDVGLREHYEMVYAMLSDFAHAGLMSTPGYANVADDGDTLTLSLSGGQDKWFEPVAAQAAVLLLELVDELRLVFGSPSAESIEPYSRRVDQTFHLQREK